MQLGGAGGFAWRFRLRCRCLTTFATACQAKISAGRAPRFQTPEVREANAAARRARISSCSAALAYLPRGQKKPRNPSLRLRGTTWTCRWGTLWLTRWLTATNAPSAHRPLSIDKAIRRALANKGPMESADKSARVSMCLLGITKQCPGKTGRPSRKPIQVSSSKTTAAGRVPATIWQNGHSVVMSLSSTAGRRGFSRWYDGCRLSLEDRI